MLTQMILKLQRENLSKTTKPTKCGRILSLKYMSTVTQDCRENYNYEELWLNFRQLRSETETLVAVLSQVFPT